ncbi:lytic transglycosylase domain-containing protein [Cryobacterium mannosilyticum]|uniref:Murein transglycosylase n=1 Tax=Cryobacterium mannosilyticum TaxID=1259190 RepID=A0A4R8W3G4_9MICO|nr:lytic murein transglycosylase [Cryobacterium mannosilyticum]TFB99953.1 murein transglycosylase [Cryobacterium mannosilyticum]
MRERLGVWACALSILAVGGWMMVGAHTPEPSPFTVAVAAALPAAVIVPGTARPGVVSPAAEGLQPAAAGSAPVSLETGNAGLVSPEWVRDTAAATLIPERALLGYAGAALRIAAEVPSCRLGWTTLAALGSIESGHGTNAGSALAADGVDRPAVFGPLLDGASYDAVADTDGGTWDAAANADRAVGPLQFIPSTWRAWGADGNGDEVTDPQQIDDAALAAGHYLCHYGDLSQPVDWRAAVFAYNHVDSYVDSVAAAANAYAAQAG